MRLGLILIPWMKMDTSTNPRVLYRAPPTPEISTLSDEHIGMPNWSATDFLIKVTWAPVSSKAVVSIPLIFIGRFIDGTGSSWTRFIWRKLIGTDSGSSKAGSISLDSLGNFRDSWTGISGTGTKPRSYLSGTTGRGKASDDSPTLSSLLMLGDLDNLTFPSDGLPVTSEDSSLRDLENVLNCFVAIQLVGQVHLSEAWSLGHEVNKGL